MEKAQEVDDRPREVEARVRLAQVQGRKGDWPAAAETLDEAVGLIRQVARDDPAEQIRLLLTAAGRRPPGPTRPSSPRATRRRPRIAEESKSAALEQVVAEARRQFDEPKSVPADLRPPR